MFAAVLVLLLCGFASCEEEELSCIKGVYRFSAKSASDSYYECTEVGKAPTLKRCEHGQKYWAVKESCHEADASIAKGRQELRQHKRSEETGKDLKQYETEVLGRGVMLGCLFDATRNMIHPADSLWTRETVMKRKIVQKAYDSVLDFFDAETMSDRLTNMKIEASIKLEFMGGLIKVEGSAAFASDTVKSLNTVATVMKAHYVTRMEILPTSTPKEFKKVCDLKHVTHVVTSLTYGMDAYFAFKKTVKKDESRKKVLGKLKIAVHSIPFIKIDGSGSLKINESMKKYSAEINLKLRGDFVLEVQPTTFEGSVKVFKNLTKHLGTEPDYNKSSPMKMTLTPITRFCGESTAILIAISKNMVNHVTEMLSKIEMTSLKIQTMQTYDAVTRYLPLQKVLDLLSTRLDELDLQMKGKLQTILPKIKGGAEGSGEKDLVALLTTYTRSPLNHERLDGFLKTRKREITLLDFILKQEIIQASHVVVVRYENADDERMLFSKETVLMLRFNVLAGLTVAQHFLKGEEVDESGSWFNDDRTVAKMGKVFKLFMAFAKANGASKRSGFLLVVSNSKEERIEVKAQHHGQIITNSFIIPGAPPKLTVTSNDYSTVTFHVERPANQWIIGFIVKYWNFALGSTTVETHFSFKDSKSYEITGLTANNVYIFSLKWHTIMGDSQYSPESSPVLTKPTSIPSNLRTSAVSSKSCTLRWDRPLHVGKGVQIQDYDVTVTRDGAVVTKKMSGGALTILVEHLKPATKYSISTQAVTKVQHVNGSQGQAVPRSAEARLEVVTSPDPPSQPILVNVGHHSAQITWLPSSKIAAGATIQEYLVQYVILNNKGDKSISGSHNVQSSKTERSITLKDLVQGSTYGMNVKVVTSLGTSGYSPILTVKTKFVETHLDKFRNSMENQIKHRVDVSTATVKKELVSEETKFTTTTGNLNKSIAHTTSTVNGLLVDVTNKLTNTKSTLLNEINNANKMLTSKFSTVGTSVTDRNKKITGLQNFHSCAVTYSIGHSKPKFADRWEELHQPMSLSQCCTHCSNRRKNDASWNFFYHFGTTCVCNKNARDFQVDSSATLGFKFA